MRRRGRSTTFSFLPQWNIVGKFVTYISGSLQNTYTGISVPGSQLSGESRMGTCPCEAARPEAELPQPFCKLPEQSLPEILQPMHHREGSINKENVLFYNTNSPAPEGRQEKKSASRTRVTSNAACLPWRAGVEAGAAIKKSRKFLKKMLIAKKNVMLPGQNCSCGAEQLKGWEDIKFCTGQNKEWIRTDWVHEQRRWQTFTLL